MHENVGSADSKISNKLEVLLAKGIMVIRLCFIHVICKRAICIVY